MAPSSQQVRRPRRTWLGYMVALVAVSVLPYAGAIKFEVQAERYPQPKCIWNFAAAHTLVIVTANVSPGPSQRMDIEIVDASEKGNVYLSKKNIKGETRLAITTHESADVGVCVRNWLDSAVPSSSKETFTRTIDLDVDMGADAVDYNAIANQESLSILEVEMRKLEGVVKEIVDELAYLQRREAKMRDTNESTNARVAKFAWFTLLVLFALGVWQVIHLRSFFKKKYLID